MNNTKNPAIVIIVKETNNSFVEVYTNYGGKKIGCAFICSTKEEYDRYLVCAYKAITKKIEAINEKASS